MRDLHSVIKVVHAVTPQAIGTTGSAGGKTSGVIDRRGFEALEFLISSGASASAADTVTPKLRESDATGSGFGTVAAADILGSLAPLTLTAAKSKSVGYRGNKRYVTCQVYGLGTATAIVAVTAILGHPNSAPVAT